MNLGGALVPVEITMPKLGESIVEGTVARWLKQVGEAVERYEPLLEVVTDKVNTEVPSPAAGILEAILVPEGETVPVGTILARLRAPGEAPGSAPGVGEPGVASGAEAEARPTPLPAEDEAAGGGAAGGEAGPDGWPRGRYSPVVRRLAAEFGIDLRQVPGTGRGGRVTREDVIAYLERQTAPEASPEPAARPAWAVLPEAAAPEPAALTERAGPPEPAEPQAFEVSVAPGARAGTPAGSEDEEAAVRVDRLKPSPVRKLIAQRMVQSRQEIPHAWTMVEVDVTGLVRLVEAEGARFREREGVPLTYLPFVIEAAARALRKFPLLNASWQGEEILVHRQIHIGVPVALEESVIVPVIRDADQQSVAGLARTLRRLVERARSGQLTVPEVEGATFTVNNTGAFGSILSQPIIFPPQAGMLTLEAIVKRPVVVEGNAIAIRSMVNLCLSLDHRVVDGLYAGRFLQQVKARLESYTPETPI